MKNFKRNLGGYVFSVVPFFSAVTLQNVEQVAMLILGSISFLVSIFYSLLRIYILTKNKKLTVEDLEELKKELMNK